jgi:hypothetical protein
MSILVHSLAKVGKTSLGETAPAPRLFLDAEMGATHLASRKVFWDPNKYAPPEADGTWDTCIVIVRDYATVTRALDYLVAGKHPFRSVIIDSLSEAQSKKIDDVAGTNAPELRDWGVIFRDVYATVRRFRDLTTHATRPLDVVMFIAMTRQRDNVYIPYIQGQLSDTAPYVPDVLAYLQIVYDAMGQPVRRLLIGPTPGFATGARGGDRLGTHIDNPNIEDMLHMMRGEDTTNVEVA